MSSLEVVEEHFISYPEAKKCIYEIIRNGSQSAILQRVYEYLNNVEKCPAEEVESLKAELSNVVKKEEVIAMIASICPTTIDELKAILVIDKSSYSDEDLQKIIGAVKSHLKS
ncbi:MAG: RNA polymerase Rpb4 family protein [Candidatus Aramenus sp.]|jgi:DNA-directed RNA polymerase subunit F|nr:RNA polymerase Rpb4 family protein [Candidatus Aramenus sp.]